MRGDYHGHMTMEDGSHVPLTKEQAKALWQHAEDAKKSRAERMPTEQDAINAMFDAFQRLRELGWREAMYCPKDGREFKVIEAGSTGVFDCRYSGEWPTGTYDVYAHGDVWPSRPILFREIKP